MPGDMFTDRSTCLSSLRYGSNEVTYVFTQIQQANQRGNIDNNVLQIPLADNTIKLFLLPLDAYVGLRSNHDISRGDRYRGVPVMDAVIIPVRAADITAEWILPYVMCHMTTAFWNHSITHSYSVKDDRAASDDEVLVTAMPRASMVRVHGKYQFVVLVMVDMNSVSCPDSLMFRGVEEIRFGNFPYGKLSEDIFTYLHTVMNLWPLLFTAFALVWSTSVRTHHTRMHTLDVWLW